MRLSLADSLRRRHGTVAQRLWLCAWLVGQAGARRVGVCVRVRSVRARIDDATRDSYPGHARKEQGRSGVLKLGPETGWLL